jgi:hypothetical protein
LETEEKKVGKREQEIEGKRVKDGTHCISFPNPHVKGRAL